MTTRDRVFRVVQQIPHGRIASYGDVGQQLSPPISGLLVGRALAACDDSVPWWRVVSATGDIKLEKRDPRLAALQRERLTQEGVTFTELNANIGEHRYDFLT